MANGSSPLTALANAPALWRPLDGEGAGDEVWVDWLFGSPVGAYVLDITPGAYNVSGVNANLNATRLLDTTVGTYALTGSSAELIYTQLNAYELLTTPASYNVTGFSTELNTSRLLDSGVGTYNVTGSSAELLYTQQGTFDLISIPGIYSLLGVDASLSYSGDSGPKTGAIYVDYRNLALERLRRELKYLYEEEDDEEVKEVALELLQESSIDLNELENLLTLIRKQLQLVQNTLTEKVNYQNIIEAAEQAKKEVRRKKQKTAAVMLLL